MNSSHEVSIEKLDDAFEIKLGCGTVLTLSDLERAGISYVPCGQVDGADQPLFPFAKLWGQRKPVKMASYGNHKNAWKMAKWSKCDVPGVQLMTGYPTYRQDDTSPDGFVYLTDIDIEVRLRDGVPGVVEQILRVYREACVGTPCEIETKSGGLRLSAYCAYLDPKREFKDAAGEMLLEIFSIKGLSRLDNRYRMLSGSIIDVPVIAKKALQDIHGLITEVATEHQQKAKDASVVEQSQLGDLSIDWDSDGKSQYFSSEFCQSTSHRSNRLTVRFQKWAGGVQGHCFNCGETWWEVPPVSDFQKVKEAIDEIDKLTDENEKLSRLDTLFSETSGLKPIYQAQIVRELMRDGLKSVHKMTKPQIEKAIKDADRAVDGADAERSDYFTEKGFNARAMRDKIIAEYPPLWTLHDTLRIYNAQTGVYETDEAGEIEKMTREELGDLQRTHSVKETFDALKSFTLKPSPVQSDALIPFENGVLDFGASLETEDWIFHPHSPDNYLLSSFPVEWNSDARCDRFSKWISEIVGPDDVQIVFEMIGSIFHLGSPLMQSSFLLIGEGSNGKSLFLDIIVSLIGIENVCTNEWADYGSNTFATADLFNKALAIDTDIQNNKPIQSAIKKAITGDWMTGQFKYRDAFSFLPVATWIGAANELPTSKDQTFGFFRRWLPIEFPNRFEKNPAFERQLKASCLTDDGKSGIVQAALMAYRAAFRNDTYTISDASLGLNDKLQITANTVAAWVDDQCLLAPDHYLTREAAYTAYQQWINADGTLGNPVSHQKFYHALRGLGCSITDEERETINGKQVRVIRGLDLKVF